MPSVDRLGVKWMEVDLDVYASNLKCIAQHTGVEVHPVLKADAYGHGAVMLSQVCREVGCSTVSVASIDEALVLRRRGFDGEILVFGNMPTSCIADLLNYRITATLCEPHFAIELNERSKARGLVSNVHLYVDTGMGRMGLNVQDNLNWMKSLKTLKNIEIQWVYSHLAVADETEPESCAYTKIQYEKLADFMKQSGLSQPFHMANSGGIIDWKPQGGTAVRPGLLSYGYSPREDGRVCDGIRPFAKLCCRPTMVKRMKKGESVGYGRSYELRSDANIATLPVGYGDGIPRSLGPHLEVAHDGKRYPVVGRICMDMMMVNLGDEHWNEDAEIEVMGGDAQGCTEWAKLTDRIPYEILTGLGPRWTKCYIKNKSLFDVVKREV